MKLPLIRQQPDASSLNSLRNECTYLLSIISHKMNSRQSTSLDLEYLLFKLTILVATEIRRLCSYGKPKIFATIMARCENHISKHFYCEDISDILNSIKMHSALK